MEAVKVKISKDAKAKIPQYMSHGAAGMDVYAFNDEVISIKPMERTLVPTGIKMEIPHGFEVQVRPRSGLAIKHGITLLNTPGTIDSDYRGEIKLIMVNLSNKTYELKPGERLAQLVLKKVYKADFEEVQFLEETARNEGGFGHTGKK